MTNQSAPVLLVGCGKMGGALLKGWIAQGHSGITVVEPDAAQRKRVESEHGVTAYADASEVPEGYEPAAVVLAVKPQAMEKIAPAHGGYTGAVYLSIAAGTTIGTLRRHLGDVAVVRAMPNLPA